MDHQKKSYECRAYELADNKPFLGCISKNNVKQKELQK